MVDSSDDDVSEQTWVFYKDRPDWNDIEPIPQDDGDEPVVSIAYSPKFIDVFNYLRGIMLKDERSERALQITTDAIRLNAANYTVWQYRRNILKSMNADLYEELKYVERCILSHQKNYQVWHHRRIIVEWLKDPSQELSFTEKVLENDAKNYHAWQHRQWTIKVFKLFDNELQYVDNLLLDDIRNNSAWNQRYFVIKSSTGFTEEVINREIEYSVKKIKETKENESAWNYLRGILGHDKNGLSKNARVTEFCESLYDSNNRSPFLLAILVDMCDEQITNNGNSTKYNLERAKELCHELATKYDTIRGTYWEYISTIVEKKAKKKGAEETSTCSAEQ